LFHADVIPLLGRILRLRNHLGVNYAGIGVILELMTRIESLENHIRELESRV
jgi:MerR family transcriptional regulator/heat shock protein HspR